MINIKNSTEHGTQDRGVAVAIFFSKTIILSVKKKQSYFYSGKKISLFQKIGHFSLTKL